MDQEKLKKLVSAIKTLSEQLEEALGGEDESEEMPAQSPKERPRRRGRMTKMPMFDRHEKEMED